MASHTLNETSSQLDHEDIFPADIRLPIESIDHDSSFSSFNDYPSCKSEIGELPKLTKAPIFNHQFTTKNKSARIQTDTRDNLVLSWENVSVYNKKRNDIFRCFKRKSTKLDDESANLNKIEANFKASDSSLISTDIDNKRVSNLEKKSIESLSSSNSTPSSSPKRKSGQILTNINGLVHSGESLAIMGASGAGKSTLLNVLNFRNLKNFNISAKIKLNGKLINADELANRSAYIQQEDLFIATLTVKEHLTFLAMLKMDPSFKREEKMNRVDEIIKDFNLEKCKDTKIGGSNNKKGISGGEKRRLAFASEILTDPQILFCDEPISGLDSHMALTIVTTLENLAKKGKIIISTIHQPSSQVFDKFDKLCLLSEGQVAYFGDREKATDFFKSNSYECPIKYNPSDYYIEILALKSNSISNHSKLEAICESYEKSVYHQNTLQELKDIGSKYQNVIKKSNYTSNTPKAKRYKSSYLTQFVWLFWRQMLSTLREPFATRILIAQSILVGFFLGFTYFRLKFDQESIQNKNGLLFMILMQSCLTYLFGVASQYHEQWHVTYRDVKNRVYSVLMYFIAKVFSEIPQNILFPCLTVSIIYWLSNINPDVEVYFSITSLIVLATNTAVGFGTFLAVVTPNINATMGLIGPTFFPLLIFSGFLINSNSIPVYFIWIKYISWIFYANEAVMITLWKNVKEISCPDNYNTTISSGRCIRNGNEVLKLISMDEKNLTLDVVLLFIMCCFWPTLSGIVIYFKSKR